MIDSTLLTAELLPSEVWHSWTTRIPCNWKMIQSRKQATCNFASPCISLSSIIGNNYREDLKDSKVTYFARNRRILIEANSRSKDEGLPNCLQRNAILLDSSPATIFPSRKSKTNIADRPRDASHFRWQFLRGIRLEQEATGRVTVCGTWRSQHRGRGRTATYIATFSMLLNVSTRAVPKIYNSAGIPCILLPVTFIKSFIETVATPTRRY